MPAAISKIQRLNARLRGTAAETIPGHYDLECECGSRISGQRSATSKQVNCPDCHTTLFILPTNVYPATPSVDSDVIGGSFGNRLRVVITEAIPLLGRQSAAPKTAPSRPDSKKKKPRKDDESQPAPRRWTIPRPSIPRFNPIQALRRTFTPLRLLALSMVALVGVTSYWVYNSRQQEAAKQIWRESTDTIQQLITAEEFESLEEALLAATQAGARIGQQGPEWRATRNLLQETQAVTNVTFETLTQLLNDLAELPADEGQSLGGLESALTEGVFVMDGYIDPAGSGDREFTVDVPVMSGDSRVVVSLVLPELAEYMARNESRRFVFAFRVDAVSVARQTGSSNAWQIDLAPDSFVLMTSEPHCRRLGFTMDSDPTLEEVLTRQRSFVEESDAWKNRGDGSGFAFPGG